MDGGISYARKWGLGLPPEWEIPKDMHDKSATEAMISACRGGQVDRFQELFESSEPGQIPPASYLIRLATESRHFLMLQYILKHYRIKSIMAEKSKKDPLPWEEREQNVHYAVLLAICQGDIAMVRRFVGGGIPLVPNIEDHHNRIEALLEKAITANQVEVAAFLLNKGANPNEWHWPSTNCMSMAASRGDPEMLSLLMEFGGRIEGSHALWDLAHMYDATSQAQTLIDFGADINETFTNSWGLQGTALHAAALASRSEGIGNTVMATWLLEHGINYTVKDKDGRTAVELARAFNHEGVAGMIENWIQDHATT